MNVGQAITMALHEQRVRDFNALRRWLIMAGRINDWHRLQAWLWWGWDLNGRGGLGRPGFEPLPFGKRRQAREQKREVREAKERLAEWRSSYRQSLAGGAA